MIGFLDAFHDNSESRAKYLHAMVLFDQYDGIANIMSLNQRYTSPCLLKISLDILGYYLIYKVNPNCIHTLSPEELKKIVDLSSQILKLLKRSSDPCPKTH